MEDWEQEYWPHKISFQEIEAATRSFSDENIIGIGGNGKVYKGISTGGAEVAVKRISCENNEGTRGFLAEISSLGRLKHRHLVGLRGWCKKEKGSLILVYDYMEENVFHLPWKTCPIKRTLKVKRRQYLHEDSLSTVHSSNYCCYHGLEYVLNMDVKKDLQVMDRRKQKTLTQKWRAMCTQSNSSEGGGEKQEVQIRVEEVHRSISSTLLTARCENPEVVNEPVDPNTCSKAEDTYLEGELAPHQKQSISMEVGASVMRFIKGKEGATQKEIEKEMGVNILFPSSKKDDSVIIEGNSAESVNKASEKIQIIIDKAVKGPNLDYSHFISLPLAIHPGLVDKLVNFQNSILGIVELNHGEDLDPNSTGDTSDEEDKDQQSDKTPLVSVALKAEDADAHIKINLTNVPLVSYPARVSKSPALDLKSSKLLDLGIEKSIFIKPKTFHLTVLMLKLWNKDRVKAAAEVLQSVSSKVLDALDHRPVSIRLKGLECMRGSFAKAHVLYAPVQEIGGEDRLLRACYIIIDAFVEAGLVIEKDVRQKLKLHATVMNARHRKRKRGARKLDSFDARGIFDEYGSEEWGEYLIREAHLSQRFAFDENGYYHCCASIPFPENMQLD